MLRWWPPFASFWNPIGASPEPATPGLPVFRCDPIRLGGRCSIGWRASTHQEVFSQPHDLARYLARVSEENVEIVRRGIDAYNRRDLEAILDDLGPEFEFEPSGRFMDTQRVYRGRAGWVDFWRAFQAAWEKITINVERMEDLGDRVLTLGAFHGTGVGSGVEVRSEAAWIHTVKDGLVVQIRSFATWKEALEAAGLSG